MTKPNANVQNVLADLAAKRDAGELEGYSAQVTEQELELCPLCRERGERDGVIADPNRFPAFFAKGYHLFTAYERGFVFGRELRLQELRDRSDHA